MSIASEITRLQTLRDNIRAKLVDLSILSNQSADLNACYTALNGVVKQTASGTTTLNGSTTSKSFPAGYYPNSHGAKHTTVNIPDPTISVSDAGLITANGSWTAGFTKDTSYSSTQQISNPSLAPENIKDGVTVLGVTGTYAGGTAHSLDLYNEGVFANYAPDIGNITESADVYNGSQTPGPDGSTQMDSVTLETNYIKLQGSNLLNTSSQESKIHNAELTIYGTAGSQGQGVNAFQFFDLTGFEKLNVRMSVYTPSHADFEAYAFINDGTAKSAGQGETGVYTAYACKTGHYVSGIETDPSAKFSAFIDVTLDVSSYSGFYQVGFGARPVNGTAAETVQAYVQSIRLSTDGGGSGGGRSDIGSYICVHYRSGMALTCTDGVTTLTYSGTGGVVIFAVPNTGTWTVTGSEDGESVSETVTVAAMSSYLIELRSPIYLIKDGAVVPSGMSAIASAYNYGYQYVANYVAPDTVTPQTGTSNYWLRFTKGGHPSARTGQSVRLSQAVDLSRYKTLHARVSPYTTNGTEVIGTNMSCYVCGTSASSGSVAISTSAVLSYTTVDTLDVDISGLTGSYYVGVGSCNNKAPDSETSTGIVGGEVRNLWLE